MFFYATIISIYTSIRFGVLFIKRLKALLIKFIEIYLSHDSKKNAP